MKVRKYYYILDPKSRNPRSVIFPLSEFSSVCKWVLDRRTLLFALVLLTFWGVSKRVEMIWKYRYLNKKEWWYWLDFQNVHQKVLLNQWKFLKYYLREWLHDQFQNISLTLLKGIFPKGGKETTFGWEATSVLAASYSYMVDLIMVHVLNYAKRVGD